MIFAFYFRPHLDLIQKEGSAFDPAMAVSILGGHGLLAKQDLSDFLIAGELSVDGKLRSVKGVLSLRCSCGIKKFRTRSCRPEMRAKQFHSIDLIIAVVYIPRSPSRITGAEFVDSYRHKAWLARNHRCARPRRDGRSLSGPRHEAEARSGHQDPARRVYARPGADRPIPSRSLSHRRPESRQHSGHSRTGGNENNEISRPRAGRGRYARS